MVEGPTNLMSVSRHDQLRLSGRHGREAVVGLWVTKAASGPAPSPGPRRPAIANVPTSEHPASDTRRINTREGLLSRAMLVTGCPTPGFHSWPTGGAVDVHVRFRDMSRCGTASEMGAIQPVRQHGERLLSGIAQWPPNDRPGSEAAVPHKVSSWRTGTPGSPDIQPVKTSVQRY